MNYYQLRLYNQQGRFLQIIEQFERLDVVRTLNTVGVLEVRWPLQFAPAIGVDYVIIVEFATGGRASPQIWGETCYFVQQVNYDEGRLTVTAYDALSLLTRRIVAYPSGTDFTVKAGPADDLIKILLRENVGEDTSDSRRRLARFEIDQNQGLGPTVEIEVAYMPLLDALQNTAKSAANKGANVYFDVLSDYDLNLKFRTYIGYRGADRRSSSVLNGNHLSGMNLDIDWSDSQNVIYIGGAGRGEKRTVELVIDETSVGQSVYGWRETFHTNRNVRAGKTLVDDGLAALRKERVQFQGDFINQPGMEFGKQFRFGDVVTVEAYGYRFETLVSSIDLTVENGAEQLSIALRSSR